MSLEPSLRQLHRAGRLPCPRRAPPRAWTAIDPALRIRSVELAVSDLPRSSSSTSGPRPAADRPRERLARLGPTEQPALVLAQIEPHTAAAGRQRPLPRRLAAPLARGARRDRAPRGRRALAARGRLRPRRLGGALPERPGRPRIEIYADRPREQWPQPADGTASTWSRCRSTSRTCWPSPRGSRPADRRRGPASGTCT